VFMTFKSLAVNVLCFKGQKEWAIISQHIRLGSPSFSRRRANADDVAAAAACRAR